MNHDPSEKIRDDMRSKDDSFEWAFLSIRTPYMRNIITNEPNHIVFDGYFYLEDETMPVEHIIRKKSGDYHIEIYEKKTLDDTTQSSYDEEFGAYISFFSTAIIDLRYRILKKIKSREEYVQIVEHMMAAEKSIEQRDRIFRKEREDREMMAYLEEANKNNKEEQPKSM